MELDLTNRMVDLVDEGIDLAIRIGEIRNNDLVAKYLAPYRMTICAAPGYLARYGTPMTPADLADHLCLSHTVWTARNEWKLPGAEEGVRWKRDAVLRCNDGYALRTAVNWCACWKRIPRSRGRFTCSGGRICGRCRS